MSEKYPKPQRDSGEQQPDERADVASSAEASDHEQQLVWEVSEALLRTVYDAVERPGDDEHPAVANTALALVQVTHAFDLSSNTDRQALVSRAKYVGDRMVELVHAHDELTTSDLQGSVEALALRLVRNQLPIEGTRPPDPAAQ